MANSIEKSYPNITHWVNSGGWIEIGNEDYNGPFVSAYDEGGTVWKGKRSIKALMKRCRIWKRTSANG